MHLAPEARDGRGLVDRLVAGLPFDVVRDRSGLGILIVYLVKEVPFLALPLLSAWDDDVATRGEAAPAHGAGPRPPISGWPCGRRAGPSWTAGGSRHTRSGAGARHWAMQRRPAS